MTNEIFGARARFEALKQTFEEMTSAAASGGVFSEPERSALKRISSKLDILRERLAAAQMATLSEAAGDSVAAQDSGRGGQARRKGRLKQMQSTIASLMASLESAR